MSCRSGDPNAGITTCQAGVCAGQGPVDCRPLSACHTAGINSDTGQCNQGFAPAGTECGNAEMCYGGFYQPGDMCDGAGFCIGGGSQTASCAPYVCGTGACLTSCASDSDCAPGISCMGAICQDSCTCEAAVISNSPTNATPTNFYIDDDAAVYINGVAVWVDDDGVSYYGPPIPVGSVSAGDTLRFVGNDWRFGQGQFVPPLHLHCLDGGTASLMQTLDPAGYVGSTPFGQPPGVFYDRTFTVSCAG
jgi:hypothetical protein